MHMPLVSLKQVKRQSKGAIFCFPGAGDGITSFITLVNALTVDLAVYGLQPQGLVIDQDPYANIEVMVDVYMKEITPKIGNNPVYLVGHSFGGFVAMRLAHKMNAMNFNIAHLVLLDVMAPEHPHTHLSRIDNLLSLIETMELGCEQEFGIDHDLLANLSDDEQLTLIHSKMVEMGMLPKTTTSESIRGMVRLFIANSHMEFFPESPYSGDALLVTAAESKESDEERLQNYSKWRKFIPSLEYTEAAGNHITLLNDVNAEKIAKYLENSWNHPTTQYRNTVS